MAQRSKFTLFPYFPFLCFSIFLALLGMLIFEYFAHGKTSMDARNPMLWASALVLFVTFSIVYHLYSAARKCSTCGSDKARDVLFVNGRRAWLCRKDLTRSIRDKLPSIAGKWLVFAPAFEERNNAGYVYCFESLTNFTKYYRSPEQSEYAVAEVGRISGNCRICDRRAEVSFFGKDAVTWERNGMFDLPDFSKLQTLPDYLCKKCAAAKVADGIEAAPCPFRNGILLPDGTNGVLFPWQV